MKMMNNSPSPPNRLVNGSLADKTRETTIAISKAADGLKRQGGSLIEEVSKFVTWQAVRLGN